jgi:hypothetical protein
MLSQIGELENTKKKALLEKLLKLNSEHENNLISSDQHAKINKMLRDIDLSLDLNLLSEVFDEGH